MMQLLNPRKPQLRLMTNIYDAPKSAWKSGDMRAHCQSIIANVEVIRRPHGIFLNPPTSNEL